MVELKRKSNGCCISLILSLMCALMVSACANTTSTVRKEKLLIADFSKHRKLNKEINHQQVQKHINDFKRDPRIFNHLDEDRLVIMSYILNEVKKRNMPAEIVMIPLIESSYRPAASNRGQHVGLWQFGAQTAKNFGVDVKNNYDGRYNTAQSTKAALDYLQYLNKMFKGDWLLTMAAYNAGEGRVLKSMKANERRGRKTDYWSIDLPPVTRAYIPKVLALSEVISDSQKLSKVSHQNIPRLARVRVETPEKLKEVLKASSIPKDVIEFYNPNLAQKRTGVRGIMLPESEVKHIKGLSSREKDKYITYSNTSKS